MLLKAHLVPRSSQNPGMKDVTSQRAPAVAALMTVLACAVCGLAQEVPSSSLSPQQLFAKVSGEIFVVIVTDEHGKATAQGSAVAIGGDEVVTNRHVASAGWGYLIRQGDKTWDATVAELSPEEDLCILRVEGLQIGAPPAVRRLSTLLIGERAYAVGAPEGLELSISEGLVSGIRKESFGFAVQTTAAISHGSSGGGLFDSNGNLIGITTFTIENSQQLNFAMPSEDISALQRQPREAMAAAWSAIGDQDMNEAGQQFYSMGPPPIGDPKAMQKWGQEFDVVPLLALWRRASHAYEEAIRIDQKNWQTWLNLAKAYSLFDENKAETVLNGVTTIAPGDVNLWMGVAKIESNMRREDAAIDAYNHALAINPNDPSILLELARAQSDPRKTLQTLARIEALHPSDASIWWGIGLQYLVAGKHKSAENAYQQAIALDGTRPLFWLSLGQLYAVEGKRSKFSEVYEHLKVLDPSTAAVLAKSAP